MIRKRFLGFMVAVALLASIAIPAGAQEAGAETLRPLVAAPSGETGAATDETPRLWFVELGSPPAAEGTDRGRLRAEKEEFRAAASRAGVRFVERRRFESLFHGFSVQVEPSQLPALTRLPGVKALYPVVTVERPQVAPSSDPDLASALALTGADVAQSELGYTGAGVNVAIMDTGIDYHHPDLGGCFGPGCRVFTGYDLVGDAFNASDPTRTTPVPDDDPDDCNGHGTHVAGIVGADGQVKGVAPGVRFGSYKVFGCDGSTTADIMIAAMERALDDGMQVLNMSIGSAFEWPRYPTAVAASRLVDRGMVVVASIGNSGANGVYSAGAPGLGDDVIGVASFDNSHINALSFTVNPGGRQVPYLPLAVTPDPPTAGTTPEIVYVGRGCAGSGPGAQFDPYLADPAGKIALIERGACTFDEKYQRAADAGAAGVIVHNNVTGLFAGGGVVSRGIFGVGISQADGLHLRSLTAPTLTWTDLRVNAPNPTGGLISSFSSFGLSPDLVLKPDVGAPGGLIRSTYPLELGGYSILSGTSMSSPHVAGAAALLLQAKPRTRSRHVREILQNSADPRPWWGNPGLGFLDNVHRQGAGMIDIDDSILATARVTPGKFSLGESEAGPATRTITIQNNGSSDVTYDLSHLPALSTIGSTFAPRFATGFASVSFSAPSVTVPAGGSARFDVTVTANPALDGGSQYGGYIELIPQGGGQTYRVPYAGFKGDYQSIVALEPTAAGFPWLAKVVGFNPDGTPSFEKQGDGATFTMAGDDVPHFVFHLAHQVRRLRVEVRDAATGRKRDRAFDLEYLPRNATSTAFFALAWDGVIGSGKHESVVPNGRYVLSVSVLKALGDDDNPAHVETWTSPAFQIQRP